MSSAGQNDCKCVEESDGTLLVSDGLSTIERCDRVETALFSYLFFDDFFYEDDFIPSFEEYELSKTGWCFSSLDKFIGSFRNVDDCWYECNIEYDSIVAIDWYDDDGSCYCKINLFHP